MAPPRSSPRSWGCFTIQASGPPMASVFPTLVGVFPDQRPEQHSVRCLPHARGGVSFSQGSSPHSLESSPRSWGCFPVAQAVVFVQFVFPTLVGVFPFLPESGRKKYCLPHARGGVSADFISATPSERSSPRSWGCFQMVRDCDGSWAVFPTLVGVFPYEHQKEFAQHGLPHARGGVSNVRMSFIEELLSSPRSWGCFRLMVTRTPSCAVFPTLVGVFPTPFRELLPDSRLPHARGGVSNVQRSTAAGRTSSPRSWGCFQQLAATVMGAAVFPTLVGVFLRTNPEAAPA